MHASLLTFLLVTITSSSLSADTKVRAVDVDRVLAGSNEVKKLQKERNSRKAVTGPKTALSPKKRQYRRLIEEAQKVVEAIEQSEPGEEQQRLRTRFDQISSKGRKLEREISATAAERERRLVTEASELRTMIVGKITTITRNLAEEKDWAVVVFTSSIQVDPQAIVRDRSSLVWVTDQVVKELNAQFAREESTEESRQDSGM